MILLYKEERMNEWMNYKQTHLWLALQVTTDNKSSQLSDRERLKPKTEKLGWNVEQIQCVKVFP